MRARMCVCVWQVVRFHRISLLLQTQEDKLTLRMKGNSSTLNENEFVENVKLIIKWILKSENRFVYFCTDSYRLLLENV